MRHNGVWGTVCDDSFDTNDGTVVCRMLGYTRASSVFQAEAGKKSAAVNYVHVQLLS